MGIVVNVNPSGTVTTSGRQNGATHTNTGISQYFMNSLASDQIVNAPLLGPSTDSRTKRQPPGGGADLGAEKNIFRCPVLPILAHVRNYSST